LKSAGRKLEELPVEDEGVIRNVDTPEDYSSL
jgi:CTP:molybdopterin cytidylyltransferase MocA